MARIHSGARGQSGSHKPMPSKTPDWVSYKPKEVETLVGKLAKEGMTSAMIGIRLRDTYGIPSVKQVTGKSIVAILKEKNLAGELPEDLIAMIKKWIQIENHRKENNQDNTARRGSDLTMAKINRLIRYYKSNGTIAADWKFNPSQASFYIE